MRWRIIEFMWKDSVVIILLQLISGALSEGIILRNRYIPIRKSPPTVELTAAINCDHLTWIVTCDSQCSVLYYKLLIYKSGLLYPWTDVSLQALARSFELKSLGLAAGSYQLQVVMHCACALACIGISVQLRCMMWLIVERSR